jgi:hypothetical protein
MLDISERYAISPFVMAAAIKQKLVELRADVLAAVESDAKSKGRSGNKQIEAILLAYYDLEDMNLRDMGEIREKVEARIPLEQAVNNQAASALMTKGIGSKGKSEAKDAEHVGPLLDETRAQRKRKQPPKKSSQKRKPK